MNGIRGFRVPVLFTVLILFLVALILLFRNDGEKPNSSIGLANSSIVWNSLESLVQFNPNMEFRNGTYVIWQIPNSPNAVPFLAHGCSGRAINFWNKSPKCPNCIGLPEEGLIVLYALARKFVVLTISSAGTCWSVEEERMIVKGIIEWWVEKYKLKKLPLVALGASSGGYFAYLLMDITKDYPPTLFVHMPKDEASKQQIDANLRFLKEEGIDVAEVKCMKFPLSPNFLADRIPADGRAIRLKATLRESKIIPPDMHFVHHIQKELNLAFAYHEMTSLQSEEVFDWFKSHMS
ncbi:hypothetical protein CsSME_00006145 [Camellia sinensis var. sinensis]